MNPEQTQVNQPTGNSSGFMNALNYAKQNPDSPFATEFRSRLESGQLNQDAQAAGIDTSKFVKQPVAPVTPTTTTPSPLEAVGQAIQRTGQNVKSAITQPSTSGPTVPIAEPIVRGVSAVGAGIGGLFDIGTKVAEVNIPQPIKDAFSSVASKVYQGTNVAGVSLPDIVDKIKTGLEQSFKNDPQGLKTATNLLNVITLGGAGAAKPAVSEALQAGKEAIPTIAENIKAIPSQIKEAVGIGKTLPEKATQTALDAITPSTKELTPTEYGDLLRSGKVLPKTATQPAQYVLSDAEKSLAQKYASLLQSGDPVKNSNNILTEIINKDKAVGDFLAKDPQVYVKSDLQNAITKALSNVSDITIPKTQLATARKDLINTVMSRIPESNSGRTYDQLWQFRKNFDSAINNKLNAFSGAPTLKKDMSRALRNGIQEFISNNTKDGVYANQMKDMTQLYDLMDMVGTKATKEKNLSGIQAWMKSNPAKVKAAKWILGGVAGYEGAKAVGVPLP